jgi:hypothetical protein
MGILHPDVVFKGCAVDPGVSMIYICSVPVKLFYILASGKPPIPVKSEKSLLSY